MIRSPEIVIPRSEVKIEDIDIGLTIGLRNPEELDELIETLGGTMRSALSDSYTYYQGNVIQAKKLSELLDGQKGKFISPLKNPRVTITSVDTTLVSRNRESIDRFNCICFLAQADVHSTGRGIVAIPKRHCILFVKNGLRGRNTDGKRYIVLDGKPVKNWVIPEDVQDLDENGRRVWQSIVRAA